MTLTITNVLQRDHGSCYNQSAHNFKKLIVNRGKLIVLLQHEYCRLNKLYLTENNLYLAGKMFTEKGKKSIREIETHEHCITRGLKIYICEY